MYDMSIKSFPSGRRVFFFSQNPIFSPKKDLAENSPKSDPKDIEFEPYEFAEKSNDRALRRTKQTIYDLAFANDWQYFLTVTFDSKKVDRHNYDDVVKKYSKLLNNLKQRHFQEMEYVMVPERHQDGAYHFHGLVKGVPRNAFQDAINPLSGKKIKQGGLQLYNCSKFNLGHNTFSVIQDSEKASTYLSKYITKTLVDELKGKKKYWSSRGLAKPAVEKILIGNQDVKNQMIQSILDSGSLVSVTNKTCELDGYQNQFTYIVTQPGIDENYIIRQMLQKKKYY